MNKRGTNGKETNPYKIHTYKGWGKFTCLDDFKNIFPWS